MWIKAAVLGGSGFLLSSLAVWTMVGLGIKIAFHSSRKRVNSVVAPEENDMDIGGLPDEENNNEIDPLPDDIVSRSTLIEAAGTDILSTKSELVFTCVSTFDNLNEYHTQVADGDKQSVLKAVDQCLQPYSKNGPKLRMILLPCCFLNGDTCHLVRWMQILAKCDVEKISLGNPCETCNRAIPEKEYTFSFKLIDGLYSLKHLRLLNCYVETSLAGRCKGLTRIDMVCLLLLSDQLSDILMSCPNLRFLSIGRCELPLNLRISGPNLELNHVEITKCYNVEKIEISDTNLMSAYIDMNSEVEISLSSLPKMKELNLRSPVMNYRFGDVTTDLPELQILMIRTPYQVLGLPPTFPAFRNVRRLVLLTSGDPMPEVSEKVDLWNFAPVLDTCPFLEKFCLAIGGPVCEEERKAEWPIVRHKHLLFVELSGFTNTQNELEFARFILTSAQVLRSFILRVCPGKSSYEEGGCRIDEDGKDSKQIDARVAEAVCADLQGHALSIHAQVMLI